MLERGRLIYPVSGVLGIIGTILSDGGQALPTHLYFTTEIDPSNLTPGTNITVHVDQDVLGTGTPVADVVSSFTLVPGGSKMIVMPFPQGATISLRGITASGKNWQLYVEPLTRYGGVQRGN